MATRNQTRTIVLIRSKGLACRVFDKEFRIAPTIENVMHFHPDMTRNQAIAKAEACAYYTDCENDAINTANMMLDFWSK